MVADGELLARREIEACLRDDGDIPIAARCAGGSEALQALRFWRPDFIFLDVLILGLDGFELMAHLSDLSGGGLSSGGYYSFG